MLFQISLESIEPCQRKVNCSITTVGLGVQVADKDSIHASVNGPMYVVEKWKPVLDYFSGPWYETSLPFLLLCVLSQGASSHYTTQMNTSMFSTTRTRPSFNSWSWKLLENLPIVVLFVEIQSIWDIIHWTTLMEGSKYALTVIQVAGTVSCSFWHRIKRTELVYDPVGFADSHTGSL